MFFFYPARRSEKYLDSGKRKEYPFISQWLGTCRGMKHYSSPSFPYYPSRRGDKAAAHSDLFGTPIAYSENGILLGE
jgi:hypothetical protein